MLAFWMFLLGVFLGATGGLLIAGLCFVSKRGDERYEDFEDDF